MAYKKGHTLRVQQHIYTPQPSYELFFGALELLWLVQMEPLLYFVLCLHCVGIHTHDSGPIDSDVGKEQGCLSSICQRRGRGQREASQIMRTKLHNAWTVNFGIALSLVL